jgi:hypothetical protein
VANTVSSTIDGQPFFLQKETGDPAPIYYSATDMRRMLSAIISKPGALGASHLLVQQAANVGMNIKVNSGHYMVADYLVSLPTDQTIDLTSFDSSPAATRTHKVYLSVYDGQVASTDTYAAKIDVIEDTGGGAATPAAATAFVQLAAVTVANNQGNIQNQNITDLREHGGMLSAKFFLYTYLTNEFGAAGSDITASNPYAQLANGHVRLGGAIKRIAGVDSTNFVGGTTYNLGTLTASLRPERNRYLIGACSGTAQSWRLQVTPDGELRAVIPTGASPTYLLLDGMSYDLD